MPAREPTDLGESTFRELLTAAITQGRQPHRTTALGPATWLAVDALARAHPEATPDHIVAACDAFNLEHRSVDSPDQCDDPRTARAAEYAAIDALVAQLRITYPAVEPETIATTVHRLYAAHDDRADRELVPLMVEQAVRQQLA